MSTITSVREREVDVVSGPHAKRKHRADMAHVSEMTPDTQTKTLVDTATDAPAQHASNVSKASKPSSSNIANRMFGMFKPHIGATDDDLIVAVLWTLHTWVCTELYTTPRVLVTSILPGAGKTTLLDWIRHFAYLPVMMAAISSASMLASLAESGHTLLMDEADRSLRKDNPLSADFLAIVNSGYKKGNSRPVQEPKKDGGWQVVNKSTFAPVIFAGNNPDLPDDTESRCIRLFLYPDDSVDESDWEVIEESADYLNLLERIESWANDPNMLKALKTRPTLDAKVKGRAKEIWMPLARVAATLKDYDDDNTSFSWLDKVKDMSREFVEQAELDRAEGIRKTSPHAALVNDLAYLWFTRWKTEEFVASADLCSALALYDPESWGMGSSYGSKITPRRLALMLRKTGITVGRNKDNTKRGYTVRSFTHAWRTLHTFPALEETTEIQKGQGEQWLDALDALDALDGCEQGASATTDDGPDDPEF